MLDQKQFNHLIDRIKLVNDESVLTVCLEGHNVLTCMYVLQ